jgi:anaerobic magnesium-protoporphyrin IX monomethyl ester cyclase
MSLSINDWRSTTAAGAIRIKLIAVEDGITALGFRRVAAVARQLNPATDIYFIATGSLYSLKSHLFPSARPDFDRNIDAIAEELAQAELVCFSSMTPSAMYVEKLARAVKARNSRVFLAWGGTHCVLYPEDAIQHVDAIFTGEGEAAFRAFYETFSTGKDYRQTPSMWLRTAGGIIKNGNRALSDADEMSSQPHLFYDLSCRLFDLKLRAFRPFTHKDYVCYNGLSYRTLWTVGCPFSCSYCANDAFHRVDRGYARIRRPSVDYMLEELEVALQIYPFISTIVFYDDNLIGLPLETIQEFSEQYKKRIDLPFVVFGMHPNFITEEKVELLARAGMNRARMGIQSGSKEILSFYERPTTPGRIKEGARILGRAARKHGMIPPAYDVISDNPLETRDDIVATAQLLYDLERPFNLNIFSLRVFPKTKLWDFFEAHPEIDVRGATASYLETRKTVGNILLNLLAIGKPPRWLFSWLLQRVRGYGEPQRSFPVAHFCVRSLGLVRRAFAHLCRRDFSTIVGSWVYYLYQMGLVRRRRHGSFVPSLNAAIRSGAGHET